MLAKVIYSTRPLLSLPKFHYHFKTFPANATAKPGVVAKRLVKCIGERLRAVDPDRWEGVPITFNTHWYNEGGYADVAACIEVHDAI